MKIEKGDLLVPFLMVVLSGLAALCTTYNVYIHIYHNFVGIICVYLGLCMVLYLPKSSNELLPMKQDKEKKKIKLLTYNLFLRPPLIKNNSSDYKEIRFEEFKKRISSFDIVALQEVFGLGNTRQQRMINHARQQGFTYVHRAVPPPLFSRKFIDAGLLILSKYPILDCDAIIYKSGFQIDFYAAKQVIYSKIQVNDNFDGNIHLFTTHMQASYHENSIQDNVLNDKARRDQVIELIDFVKSKIENTPELGIIAGDFNINARANRRDAITESEEYKQMMQIFHQKLPDFEIKNLLKEIYGYHPCTYADVTLKDGKTIPRETVLTHTADYCTEESIDYIFSIQKKNTKISSVVPQKIKIKEFFVNNLPVTQLSDHYALSLNLMINDQDISQ